MDDELHGTEATQTIENLLGYLNFSSGAADPQFLGGMNSLFGWLSDHEQIEQSKSANTKTGKATRPPIWRRVVQILRERLDELHRTSPTFHDVDQASRVLQFVSDRLVVDYLEFHRDLLFHQTESDLWGPFLLGRFFEVALPLVTLAGTPEEWSRQCIAKLNDFIGHRPVAILESRKIEANAHEWVRPVPLYVEAASVAMGRYGELVQQAIELLSDIDDDLEQAAYFDFSAMSELAFDPRAYDFEHPVNKRPNYHFGEWDPHLIDNKGQYRRFVVREVTLQALLDRVDDSNRLRHSARTVDVGGRGRPGGDGTDGIRDERSGSRDA